MNLITARLIASLLFLSAANLWSASEAELAAASKEAVRLRSSKAGYDYETKFLDAIDPGVQKALGTCRGATKVEARVTIIFQVSADGRVTRVLTSEDNVFARCMASHLRGFPRVPRPPHGSWAVALDLTVRP